MDNSRDEIIALRPRDAAKRLGISERTLWEYTDPRGPIPCRRVGSGPRKFVLYSVEELKRWLRNEDGTELSGYQDWTDGKCTSSG